MTLADLLNFLPTFALGVFRVAGLFLAAPMFASGRIPRRIKLMFAIVATLGIAAAMPTPVALPADLYSLTAGIVGEIIFGLVLGMGAGFTFVAAQWAGEVVGQQMGFNISEVLDPSFGGGGSVIGDIYFIMTLMIFFAIDGHTYLVSAVADSFTTLPLLTAGINETSFDMLVDLLSAAAVLAMRLAAPVFVTMLVVDLALGAIGKTMPQMNLMTAGLSLRAGLGLFIVMIGIFATYTLLKADMHDTLTTVDQQLLQPAVP